MTRLTKFIMIILTIVSFSCGLVNLMAMFVSNNPYHFLALGLTSLIVSHAINQEIIENDDNRINEYDETF